MAPAVPASSRTVALWRRFAAGFYDLLPLVGLWIVGAGLWTLVLQRRYDPAHPDPWLQLLLDAWLLAVTAAYFVVSWVRVGATIGMRAWRFRLVRDDGSRIGVRLGIARFALALVSLAALGCGFWCAWFDADRRTWHDRVCGTRMTRF